MRGSAARLLGRGGAAFSLPVLLPALAAIADCTACSSVDTTKGLRSTSKFDPASFKSFAVAGGEQHRDAAMAFLDAFRKADAVDRAGHHDVAEHQIECLAAVEEFQRFGRRIPCGSFRSRSAPRATASPARRCCCPRPQGCGRTGAAASPRSPPPAACVRIPAKPCRCAADRCVTVVPMPDLLSTVTVPPD